MNVFFRILEGILPIDAHLTSLIAHTGSWSYLVLFLIIFCETGLVVTPFLPGDSLLFGVGALAGQGAWRIEWLIFLLCTAAILGDFMNYKIGRRCGHAWLTHPKAQRLINPVHLEKTERFFRRHGSKAIVLARFVPIIRTIAPFLAGIGNMPYSTFLTYNVVGVVGWISLFLLLGYFFGRTPFVKAHFSLIIIGVILISLLPLLIEVARDRIKRQKEL